MNLINSIGEFLNRLLQWWFKVMPWEQAIHVRRGKVKRVLTGGLYMKIPFIDSVFVQTTKMRMIDMPMQTMTTKDGAAITIKGSLGYSISNIERLFNTLYHPELTMVSLMQGAIAAQVRSYQTSELTSAFIEQKLSEALPVKDYGLSNLTVKITTFAIVKTFRIIQDSTWMTDGLEMKEKK